MLAVGPPQPPTPSGTGTTATTPVARATGLYGYVTRGPIAPLCRPGESCFRPARLTLEFRRPGRLAVKIATSAAGAYRVALAPGDYTVFARTVGLGRLKPGLVRVSAGRFRRVDFVLGTGIY